MEHKIYCEQEEKSELETFKLQIVKKIQKEPIWLPTYSKQCWKVSN